MSAAEKATEVVTEAAADVAGDIAQQAEQMETFIRSMNKVKVQFGLLGAALGAAGAGMAAFAIAYRKAESKYSKIADEEISEMREHYQAKGKALEAEAAKRPVEEIVKERGYASDDPKSVAPPMAIPPPTAVVEDATEEPPEVRNIFREAKIEHVWDYHAERRRRSPDIPYVIHYDERHELDYQDVTLTYYEVDDVLCTDRDEIIDISDRDGLIGEGNLERFGHGSNDAAIVYIRNDKLELIYEVVKSPNSYSEEVHGFTHDAGDRRNLERMRARERDEER